MFLYKNLGYNYNGKFCHFTLIYGKVTAILPLILKKILVNIKMVICQFCNSTFTSKISLSVHQKRAKYCLEKQGKQVKEFHCKHCDKIFYEKRRHDNHVNICSAKNKTLEMSEIIQQKEETIIKLTTMLHERETYTRNLIDRYEAQIRDLNSRLENVAIKGATKSTNTNILKLENLTDEHLKNCARLLTAEHVSDVSSLAKFAADHSFKDRVITTDQSRKTLAYKKDGKVVKDPKGKQLAIKFFSSIKDQDITKSIQDQIFREMGDVSDEERKELFERMDQIIKIEKGIIEISQGETHDLKEEFIHKLCEIIPNQE